MIVRAFPFSALETLTKVPQLSVEQLAELWFDNSTRRTATWMQRQVCERTVTLHDMMLHPEIPLFPLIDWHPHSAPPDIAVVARHVRGRWAQAPVATVVVRATATTHNEFGSIIAGHRLARSLGTHDLHMARIFIDLVRHNPDYAKQWISEAELIASNLHHGATCIPDAIIQCDPPIMIEFAGRYQRRKLERIHEAFKDHRYQLY